MIHALCWLIAWFPCLLLAQGCAPKALESEWSEGDVCIDGRGTDWSAIALHYVEDMRLSYGTANNDDFLFLVISIRDLHTARMLEGRGLTLWFDVDCGRKKTVGIRYAREVFPNTEPPGVGERGEGPKRYSMEDFRRGHQPPSPKGRFSFVTGSGRPQPIPKAGLEGIEAAAGCEETIFCYEIKMPIGKGTDALVSLDAVPGQEIEMGIEIGGAGPEEREAAERMKDEMAGRRGGGPPGGGPPPDGGGDGGRGGGMRAGGPRGGGRAAFMDKLDTREIWVGLRLAEKETVS